MQFITQVRHENDVHELIFSEASRNSVEEFIALLFDFYENLGVEHIYLLLNLRESGMLPLRHFTARMRELNQQCPNHPALHMALALNDSTLADVTSALMRTIMRRDSAQYFTDIDKAYFWLKMEQDKQHSLGD